MYIIFMSFNIVVAFKNCNQRFLMKCHLFTKMKKTQYFFNDVEDEWNFKTSCSEEGDVYKYVNLACLEGVA